MNKTYTNKQILAITNKIKKGKAKTPAAAKAKINQIRQRIVLQNWLSQ